MNGAQIHMHDMLIIGGGINGAGIARDAAGRGLDVVLCEKNDLASATSSASSKLVHGGLRYLEQYEFGLVRKALAEREVLMALAPHLVQPMTFILPHSPAQRPAWLIRLGLFFYDHLGRRKKIPASHAVDLSSHPAGTLLDPQFRKGFAYTDCRADDSRLVVANAKDAHNRGATILTRTEFVGAECHDGIWRTLLRAGDTGLERTIESKVLVNAAGPWVEETLKERLHINSNLGMRLIRGSHIVVPRLTDHEYAYLLQNADGRIVFIMPFATSYTLIGTTEVEVAAMGADTKPDESEVVYLIDLVNRYLAKPIGRDDIVWSFAGVRPLFDDANADATTITRGYVLDLDNSAGAPILSIFGGKITAFRQLAEAAMDELGGCLPVGLPWTAGACLPGGDLGGLEFDQFSAELCLKYGGLPQSMVQRFAHAYGAESANILGSAKFPDDLGLCFGADLYQCEVDFLVREEWARTSEDILWRRSKLGLEFEPSAISRLDAYLPA